VLTIIGKCDSIVIEREVIKMKTVIIEYAKISPAVLDLSVTRYFPNVLCNWRDIDEDFFEFSVMFCPAEWYEMLEDFLAEYV